MTPILSKVRNKGPRESRQYDFRQNSGPYKLKNLPKDPCNSVPEIVSDIDYLFLE